MLPRNKKLKFTAAILRKNMTKQEKHLWYDYLAKHTVKFYRQKIIVLTSYSIHYTKLYEWSQSGRGN